jgi:two-component system, OmpR family, phosphate regulon sensor histidine kinase PhoR
MNMESRVQPQIQETESAYRSFTAQNRDGDRLTALRQQMEQLNTIGKRFVAAIDRFQVHRALLATLQELYSFSACSILLKGNPIELSIIPRYPLTGPFLEAMIQSIARAASAIDIPDVTAQELAVVADLDAPDDLAPSYISTPSGATEIGDFLNIPLTVENRIMGILSLFDEHVGTFDTELLQLTTMIADYAAVALENVRLREREMALWRDAEHERQRLELIISSMAEGLLITDAQGAITSLNSSAQQLLAQAEVNLEQETPTSLRQLAASTNVSWLLDLADIVDQAMAGNIVMNWELIAGDIGETIPLTLSISAAPLHDTSQTLIRPIGVVAVLNDITSNKQIEKLKDEFVSIVSHELRTPLTAIKGYTQHLIRRIERRLREARQKQQSTGSLAEPSESYDLRSLNIVQSETEHLERLVSDLLDLSRVQWGELDLQYTSFYLADILAERVRLAQVSAEQHTIILDIQAQDSRIMADQLRVGQIFGNILDNAIRFSPPGRQVTVKLQEQEQEYLISVIDQGIGVSPEYFDHIFERFYRVRNTTSRQYSGIGMGLYVAKAIVEAHGGRIGFYSDRGIGSTFYFTLPRVPRTSILQM